MCSKCNGCFEDSPPRSAIELLEEAERRKKEREKKKHPSDEFVKEYIR